MFLGEWGVIISLNFQHIYCLLFAGDSGSRENYKVSKRQNYWRDCEIPTKGRICYRKHCHGPDDRRGRHNIGYHCQTEFI